MLVPQAPDLITQDIVDIEIRPVSVTHVREDV